MNADEILANIALQGGGLIEIYVMDGNFDDWKRAIARVQELGFVSTFSRAGQVAEPIIQREMFTDGDNVEYSLNLLVGRQVWSTGFYSEVVIDFQGDPNEVNSVNDLNDIFRLMNALHESTGKRVVLVPETVRPDLVQPYVTVG